VAEIRYDPNPQAATASTRPTTRYASELGDPHRRPHSHHSAQLIIDAAIPRHIADMSIVGWIPVGDDMEAVWTERDLYLMKEAGHTALGEQDRRDGGGYDGKYFGPTSRAERTMMAIDRRHSISKTSRLRRGRADQRQVQSTSRRAF